MKGVDVKIMLQRLINPQVYPEGAACVLCEVRFGTRSVLILDAFDAAIVCERCLEHLAERNPEGFPSMEFYEELCREYPEPLWPSPEATARAEEDGTFGPMWDAGMDLTR
jgi:hypothetical protein